MHQCLWVKRQKNPRHTAVCKDSSREAQLPDFALLPIFSERFQVENTQESDIMWCCYIKKTKQKIVLFISTDVCELSHPPQQKVCNGVGGASWQRSVLHPDRRKSHDSQRLLVLWCRTTLGQAADWMPAGLYSMSSGWNDSAVYSVNKLQ